MADLLIYGDIGGWWDDGVFAADVATALQDVPVTDSVLNVRINSVGGITSEGIAIRSQLRSFANKRRVMDPAFTLNTIIDGYAYSAASVIAMAGDKIIMNTGTMMMIHNAWAYTAGNAEELREMAVYLDKVDSNIADIYVNRTGKKNADIAALMNAETFFSAKEAVAAGFADQIDEDAPAVLDKFGDDNETIAMLSRSHERNAYARFMDSRFAVKSKAAKRSPQKLELAAEKVDGPVWAYRLKMLELELDN